MGVIDLKVSFKVVCCFFFSNKKGMYWLQDNEVAKGFSNVIFLSLSPHIALV